MPNTIYSDVVLIIRTLRDFPDLSITGLQRKMRKERESLINRDRLRDLCKTLDLLKIIIMDKKQHATYLRLTETDEEIAGEI